VAFLPATGIAQTDVPVASFAATADEYRDPVTAVSFRLPRAWKLERAMRWGDHETTLFLRDPESSAFAGLYYQWPRAQNSLVDIEAEMRESIEEKARQRRQREKLLDYRVLPESVRALVVDGQPARTWLATFTRNGREMVEYLTRIQSPGAVALFYCHLPATELPAFRLRFDPVISSLRLPSEAAPPRRAITAAAILWRPIAWVSSGTLEKAALDVPVQLDGVPGRFMRLDTSTPSWLAVRSREAAFRDRCRSGRKGVSRPRSEPSVRTSFEGAFC
jgi:hypothetical protein